MLRYCEPIRDLLHAPKQPCVNFDTDNLVDIETPFGTVFNASFDLDAVFVVIPSAVSQRQTHLIGRAGTRELLKSVLMPIVMDNAGPEYNPEGFKNLRFIGWIVDGVLVLSGVVPRPITLWLCYNRQRQADFSLALCADPYKDVSTVVASTSDQGGIHLVRLSDVAKLWDRIEIAIAEAGGVEMATYSNVSLLTTPVDLSKSPAAFLSPSYPMTTCPRNGPNSAGGLVLLNTVGEATHTQQSIQETGMDTDEGALLWQGSMLADVARAGVRMRVVPLSGFVTFYAKVMSDKIRAGSKAWALVEEDIRGPNFMTVQTPFGDNTRAGCTSVKVMFTTGVKGSRTLNRDGKHWLYLGQVTMMTDTTFDQTQAVTIHLQIGNLAIE